MQEAVIHMNESITWSYTTAIICALGWALHWLMMWGEAWKLKRTSLMDNVLGNLPAFISSITATVIVYMIGPGAVAMIGIDLSTLPTATAGTLANLGAFIGGFLSDSIVARIASLVRKPAP